MLPRPSIVLPIYAKFLGFVLFLDKTSDRWLVQECEVAKLLKEKAVSTVRVPVEFLIVFCLVKVERKKTEEI